MLSLELVRTH